MSLPRRYRRAFYEAYIRSPEWQEVRRRFFKSKLYKGRCSACHKADVPLDVHHWRYKRLGHEWLTDLVALCRGCHDDVHRLERASPYPSREQMKEMSKSERRKVVTLASATKTVIRAKRPKSVWKDGKKGRKRLGSMW